MTKAQLQEKLQPFKNDDEFLGVEMYLLYEDEQKNIITVLPSLEEEKLSVALEKIVKAQIKNKLFSENSGYQYEVVSANTAEATNNRQVFYIDKSEIPKASEIFDAVVEDTAEVFSNNLDLEKVWAYIFKVKSVSNGTIFLFKKNYPINVLKKDSSYGIFFKDNMLKLFDKDLLRLSTHCDVILIDDDLIILNRSEFEKAFDYVEAKRSSGLTLVQVIENSGLVENLEIIEKLLGDKQTLKKILNINPNSKLFDKTAKQIVRTAKKYYEFKLTTDESKLSITSKKAAIAFVQMLNDDFLKSEFSGNRYNIQGKSPIEKKVHKK